jgi:hypothetical protein
MRAVPVLHVTLLINIHRRRRDTTLAERIVVELARRLWDKGWSGSPTLQVFDDPDRGSVTHQPVCFTPKP